MVTFISFIAAAIILTVVFGAGWLLGLRTRSKQKDSDHDSELRSLRAALERFEERLAPVPTMTAGDPGDIPDGIVHDDVRDQLRRLAAKWGSTPKFVLRCAVTAQVVKAWKEEEEEGDRESGEVQYNVSSAEDDTGTMFQPGYAEEVAEEPTAAEDDDGDEEPVSEPPISRKPTKH